MTTSRKIYVTLSVAVVAICFNLSSAYAAYTTVNSDVTADTTWTTIASPYLVDGSITIADTATLTIEPGVIIKFSGSSGLIVDGTIVANGDAATPIYFTSSSDDSIGGDTNGNGAATVAAPGDWNGIRIQSGGIANFYHTDIRYAGYYRFTAVKSSPAIINAGGTLTIQNSNITDNRLYGIGQTGGILDMSDTRVSDHTYGVVVLSGDVIASNSTIENNTSRGFFSQTTGSVSLANNHFLDNSLAADIDVSNLSSLSASGNEAEGGQYNGIVIRGNVVNELNLSPGDLPYIVTGGGGADYSGALTIITASGLEVGAAGSLTFEAGSVVKFASTGAELSVYGSLVTNGAADNQVHFTSLKDDSVGGDTDGTNSQPSHSDWRHLIFNSGSLGNLNHTNLRYAGYYSSGNGSRAGIVNSGGDITLIGGSITNNNQYGLLHNGGHSAVTMAAIDGNGSYGVLNNTAADIDARNNYWGDSTGPLHFDLNPDGLGDRVSDNVQFEPWCEKEDCTTEPEIDPLLLQYAPILYFHEDESYYPMNVEAFIEDSALWSKDGLGDTLLKYEEELTVEEFEDIVVNYDTSDYYLAYSDPDNAKSIDLEAAKEKYDTSVLNGKATSTVYVHKMTDGYTDSFGNTHDFIVLQYWFFYAMNNWAEQEGFNNHEGDWESVFVFLDADTEDPQYVAYSAHLNEGEPSLSPAKYGSVRRTWDSGETVRDNFRVVTFIAVGSHANYPNNGIDGIHDIPFQSPDRTSYSGNKLETTDFRNVLDENLLLTFGGKWGADSLYQGFDGPQGPGFIDVTGQIRFYEPVEWAGLNNVNQTELEETDFIELIEQGVTITFDELLADGTDFYSSLHSEAINFGSNVDDYLFLPYFWDFELGIPRGTFTATVTLNYKDDEIEALELSENLLSAFYFNEDEDVWETVPSAVNTANNTVTFVTDHFSRYAIGVLPSLDTIEYKKLYSFNTFKSDEQITKLQFKNETNETLTDTIALVVTDLPEGVELTNKDGDSPYGPYILLEPSEYGQCDVSSVDKHFAKFFKFYRSQLQLCTFLQKSPQFAEHITYELEENDYSSPITLRLSLLNQDTEEDSYKHWNYWKQKRGNNSIEFSVSILPLTFLE